MKLRLRQFQSKETLKIEVPNSCPLPHFRQILSQTLPNSPSPASIRLSLNRKEYLHSDGADTLQSLGVTAGDLIYYSIEEPQTAVPEATGSAPTPRSKDPECSSSLNPQNTIPGVENSGSLMSGSQKRKTLGVDSQTEVETVSVVEVDGENNYITDESVEVVDKSFSVPGFLRKVFATEMGDDDGRNHKLIVIAVHAVLLESGFVGVDAKAKANAVVDNFQLRNEWPSGLSSLSLFYTLRESVHGDEATMKVLLKFQSVGTYLNVYGQLGKRGLHRVQLNESELDPFLNVVWANCEGDAVVVTGEYGETSPEKEVFKFWRIVKDDLALPLLIDFCEEAGLVLPPCFMRLPTELKLKILKPLPGIDLAKVSCVSPELRYLASSDDLWKMKLSEEFGIESKEGQVSWKKAFSMAWSMKKGRFLETRRLQEAMPYWHQPRRRWYPNIFQRALPIFRDQPRFGVDEEAMILDGMRNERDEVFDLQNVLHPRTSSFFVPQYGQRW